MAEDLLEKIVSLSKRRGFIYPNSEIYGGLSNAYDYGPLGAELLRNIRNLWWKRFVHDREDMYGIDGAIISNPKAWEASGHTTGFADALIECRNCHSRFRADHFIEDNLNLKVEGKPLGEIDELIVKNQIHCPVCGQLDFTPARKFNLLFRTSLGSTEEDASTIYLRGETALNIFLNYKNALNSFSPRLPFGIAQIGKVFRNEVTLGNFIFRTFEFEQMEIEYFIRPENWEACFEYWKKEMWQWLLDIGIEEKKLSWRRHSEEELSHYSKRTEDIEYEFPFGVKELYGLAYRTDFDLTSHMKASGVDLNYTDPQTGEKSIPHVVEPTFGVTRTLLVVLLNAYREDDKRVFLKIHPKLAPYKVAVFPLLANKPELIQKAREVFDSLRLTFNTAWDDRGNIGKRYYSQDEIGTPWCVTIDFQTLEDGTVTVRDRDTASQERIPVSDLSAYFSSKL